VTCSIVFVLASSFRVEVDASNIGTGFRQPPGIAANLAVVGGTGTGTNSLRANGSARVRIDVTPTIPLGLISFTLAINAADAVTDDIALNETWYFRNNWHQLSLYNVSKGLAPGPGGAATTPVGACGGANPPCLTINDPRYAPMTRQAALIIAGRALQGQARPSAAIADFLEGENLAPLDEVMRRGAANRTINDRVVSIAP
jgi:hypothetical protein